MQKNTERYIWQEHICFKNLNYQKYVFIDTYMYINFKHNFLVAPHTTEAEHKEGSSMRCWRQSRRTQSV